MATPAAVLSTLIKVEGLSASTAQIAQYDKMSRKSAASADKLTAATTAQGRAAKTTGRQTGGATKAVAGFIGAFAGYQVIKKSVDATTQFSRSTLQLSRNFGLSTKAASEWSAVMQARGVTASRLTMSFRTFSQQVKAAGDGSKKSAEMFKQLGVSQQELAKNGDNLQWMLTAVSNGLAKLPAGTNRAAIMGKLFGRTWQTISPVIRDGAKSMNEQLAVADKYGATLSGSTKSTEQMIAKQREFKLAMLGLQLTLGQAIMPALTALVDTILKGVTAFRQMSPTAKIVVGVILGLSAAMWALNAAVSANPLVALGVAIAALVVGFITLYNHSARFRAIIDSIWKTIQPFAQALLAVLAPAVNFVVETFKKMGGLTGIWNTLKSTAAGVISWLTTAWGNVTNWIVTAWRKVSTFLGPSVSDIGVIFRTAFNVIRAAVTPVFQLIAALIGPLIASLKTLAGVVKSVLAAAFTTAWNLIKTAVSGIVGVVRGAFDIIRGIIKVFAGLFTGDFSKMWDGIKLIFSGALRVIHTILKTAVSALVDVVKGIWNGMYNAGKYIISGIGEGIKAAWHAVVKIVENFLNALLSPINFVLGKVGVGKIQVNFQEGGKYAKGGVETAQKGQRVTHPGFFAGEQAPHHPEYILATNPAYRQRNLGLWAQAGSALGAPGFQAGGVYGFAGLERLWEMAGGPYAVAPTAAAVALAESTGRVNAHNPSGASGLWQILGQVVPGNIFNPLVNARNAVKKFLDAGGFTPWVQFVNGAYKAFLPGGRGSALSGMKWVGMQAPDIPDVPGGLPQFVTDILNYPKRMIGDFIGNAIKDVGKFFGGPGSHLGTMMPSWEGIGQLASQYGLTMTSGLRPGDVGSYHASGHARDYSNGIATPQELAFARGVAAAYGQHMLELIHTPLGWGIKNGQKVDQNAVYGSVLAGHYNHVHTAFQKGGVYAGAFGSGGMVSANRPTVAVFGENGPETAMFVPGFAAGGFFSMGSSSSWGKSGGRRFVGPSVPQTPRVNIAALTSVVASPAAAMSRVSQVSGAIGTLHGNIEELDHSYQMLDSVFNLNALEFVDPVTGARNEDAIATRLSQLDQLIAIRQQILSTWDQIIQLTNQLIGLNQTVLTSLRQRKQSLLFTLSRLKAALSGIVTRGLKGSALTSANKHKTEVSNAITKYQDQLGSTNTDIETYSGNVTAATDDLRNARWDRDFAWLAIAQLGSERAGVAGTKAQTPSGAGPATPTAPPLTLDPNTLASLLTANNLVRALPTFAMGGLSTGGLAIVGERGPEIASFPTGTRIYANGTGAPASAPVIQVVIMDGAVDPNKIQVIAEEAVVKVTRTQARNGARRLPGAGGGAGR